MGREGEREGKKHRCDRWPLVLTPVRDCRGPALAGLRVPEGWAAQVKNEGSDTKFDARERPALVGLTEL